MAGDILTFSEDRNLGLELISAAKALAKDTGGSVLAVAAGPATEDMAKELASSGASKVLRAESESLKDFDAGLYTDVLAAAIREHSPHAVIIGSTKTGNELAPRLAARLACGAVTDVSELWLSGGALMCKRIVYGGNAVGSFKVDGEPAVVTVPQGAYAPPSAADAQGEVVELRADLGDPLTRVVSSVKKELKGVSLKDAEIIVSIGRGLKSKEDLRLVRELADALGGEVGCSRPIAADLEWLPKEHWIGLSGVKVKPRVYFTIGISGQIQHIAGMRDSDIIVAINTDPDAPIFQAADYGIVGDLYKVVPALTEMFKKG